MSRDNFHPAPFFISARGGTFQDLFQDASGQLLSHLIEPSDVSEAIREKIVLQAPDLPALLRDWVNALLGLAGRQGIIFSKVRFQKLDEEEGGEARLNADVVGELIDPVRHAFRKNPQALRCSEALITRKGDQVTATLSFPNEKPSS